MKTTLIVGNGFNYMVESWIKNYPNRKIPNHVNEPKDDIARRVNEITQLWKKFNTIFKEIKSKNPNLNDEELIRIIYSVIDLFSSMPGLEKIMTDSQLKNLTSLFENFLLDKIKEIAIEFKNHHEDTGYKNIKRLFPDFGKKFNDLIKEKNLRKLSIYTTNYDGILDTLLTNDPYGFIFRDGFGTTKESDELLEFYDYNFNYNKIICHLHGSYLYKRYFGSTYKLKTNIENTDPIMVFNNPDMKESIIRRDSILSRYLNSLSNDISNTDKIIIFGNSMQNEPHIKEIFQNFGNRNDLSVYVCSPNPNMITKEIQKYFKTDIFEINTNGMTNMNKFLEKMEDIM